MHTTLSVSSVSVAGRAGHAFTPQAMLKGFECHKRGVELEDPKKDRVLAHVKAPKAYDVDLRIANGRLLIQCTCPSEAMTPAPCKHAWAALLEVDRQGAFDELRERRGHLKVQTLGATTSSAQKAPAAKAPPKKVSTKVAAKKVKK